MRKQLHWSKAEHFIGYKDKADKQTPVSSGRKKQFHECKRDPMATLQQAPPPFLLDLRKGLQESKANEIMWVHLQQQHTWIA